jgi:hypothetical protein
MLRYALLGIALIASFGHAGAWLAPLAFGVLPHPLLWFAAALALSPLLINQIAETHGRELT